MIFSNIVVTHCSGYFIDLGIGVKKVSCEEKLILPYLKRILKHSKPKFPHSYWKL